MNKTSNDKDITTKRLIVNADDLGRTVKINQGIQKAFLNGIVSSTSIVANSPAFSDAVNMVKSEPLIGVGIHLALHEYPPLTNSKLLQDLAAKNMTGAFTAIAFMSSKQIKLIEEEFRKQIEKVIESGIKPTHLDGHNHVHVHPRLINILVRLTKEYSIKYIRLPKESWVHYTGFKRYIEKAVLNCACCFDTLIVKDKLYVVDEFYGFSEGGNLTKERIEDILKKIRPGVSELMCHVGLDNDDPPFLINYNWRNEYDSVVSYTKRQLNEEYGIKIISYGTVAKCADARR